MKNYFTKQTYKGETNITRLQKYMKNNNLIVAEFLTFCQIKALGFNLKKGSKGCRLYQHFVASDKTKVDDEIIELKNKFKTFVVFGIEMCESI